MDNNRYLVTGITGQLGYDVVRELNKRGIFNVLAPESKQMDITDRECVEKLMHTFCPNIVIHCAAYTNVKESETESGKIRAFKVNVEGTKNIIESASRIGAKVIYVSTDYVFDGKKDGIYEVDDITNPLNIYGKTKLIGENIAINYDKSFVVRTSWVFGIHGNNFVKTMLEQAKTKDSVSVVKDQIGSPTYTVDLANFLIDLSETDYFGIYQAHNEGFCSWFEFTESIYKEAKVEIPINPVCSTDFPSSVVRPLDTRMSTKKIEQIGVSLLPSYEDATKRYLKELRYSK